MRPVRWLVAMLDEEVVPLELFGLTAGKTSRGHRIIFGDAGSGVVTIAQPGAYVEALRTAKVLGAGEREQAIRKALDAATRTIAGARWREDKALLETVVNLTEFPSVIFTVVPPSVVPNVPTADAVWVARCGANALAMEFVATGPTA